VIVQQAIRSWVAMSINIVIQLGKVPFYYLYLDEFTDVWFLLVGFMGGMMLFEGGITFTAIRYLGRAIGDEDQQDLFFVFKKLKNLFRGAAVVYFFAVGFFSFWYVKTLALSEDMTYTTYLGVLFLVVGTAVAISLSISGAMLSAIGKTGTNSLADTFSSATAFFISYLLLVLGLGFIGIAIGEALRPLISALVKRYIFFRDNRLSKYINLDTIFSREDSSSSYKVLLKSQWMTSVANGGMLFFIVLDSIFLGQALGASNAANYINSQNAIAMMAAAVGAITIAILPHMLHSVKTKPDSMIMMLFGNMFLVTAIFSLLAGGVMFFGEFFFSWWIGPENYIGATFIFLFLTYYFFEAVASVLLNGLYSKEYLGYWRAFWISAVLRLVLGLFFILVLEFGLYAIIATKLLTYPIIVVSFALWKLGVLYNISGLWKNISKIVLPYLSLIFLTFFIINYFDINNFLETALFFGIYLICVFIVSLTIIRYFKFDVRLMFLKSSGEGS